jgi:hypothetical protein
MNWVGLRLGKRVEGVGAAVQILMHTCSEWEQLAMT